MRYASCTPIAIGAAALSYLQVAGGQLFRMSGAAEPLPMLFAGAFLTMGLLLLIISKKPSIHPQI